MADPVVLTVNASRKVIDLLAKEERKEGVLRLARVRTHCMGGRGYAYRLTLEAKAPDGDVVYFTHGLPVAVVAEDAPYVGGTVIDYVEEPSGAGFVLKNPLAVGRCPCGHHDLFG